MNIDVTESEIKQAKAPHDLFIFNLIGNHILVFVGVLSVAFDNLSVIFIVPLISLCIIVYTFYKAKQSLNNDTWFVMCHWQLTLKRSKILLAVIFTVMLVAAFGYIMLNEFNVMKEAVIAFIAGIGLLPLMITVLILIVMESDAQNQVTKGYVPDSIAKAFPQKNQ